MNIFPILLASFFAFLSAYAAFFGIKHCIEYVRMFRADRYAPGIVTRIKTEQRWRKGRSWIAYTAVITYYTAWNEKREIDYANPLGSDAFKVGDKLTVWYDVNDPEVFSLGGWYFVKDIASFFVFAMFLGVPGWGVLVLMFKHYIHF